VVDWRRLDRNSAHREVHGRCPPEELKLKRVNLTSLIAAFIVTLFLAGPAGAVLENMWLINYNCTPAGLPNVHVWRLYCRFSDPGDRLIGVYGNPASPAIIQGSFYQNPFGGTTAPLLANLANHPQAQWDTFCTIGKALNDGDDWTMTTPGFPSWPVNNNTNMGWFVPPKAYDQGAPDHDGMVLIAQLAMGGGSIPGNVRVGITYVPAGSSSSVSVNNVSYVLLPLTAGDVNHDFLVNINDLVLVLTNWGATGQGIPDATDDGEVNIDDLVVVITHWGFFVGGCS
jgi:hypothetical protein